jgi:hypothetical protein
MVGGRTANGHVITKRDRFVSLPCYCSLSTRGGDEYKVRLTYRGRSTVVPVYDVGPWNRRDNYWDAQEQRVFSDLRQGWPQDHAAYFDGHNGGRSGLGWKVSYPTAVDVGDGAWWDDLNIVGDRAELEVTFLWMGADPAEQAPPPAPEPPQPTAAPPAPEQPQPTAEPTAAPEPPQPTAEPTVALEPPQPTAEPTAAPEPPKPTAAPEPPQPTAEPPQPTAEPTAAPEPPKPTSEPPQPTAEPTAAPEPPKPTAEPTAAPAAAPASAPAAAEVTVDDGGGGFAGKAAIKWYHGPEGCGRGGHALWTYSAAKEADAENSARWSAELPADGMYDVSVYVPGCAGPKSNTTSARYAVSFAGGSKSVTIDQASAAGSWVSLGRYAFAAGKRASVELHDVTGNGMDVIWFDAVRWTPAP